jgi:hypothetical protein
VTNLDILRCLKEHEELPYITQMFFHRCCSATLQSTEQRDRGGSSKQVRKHPGLHKTFRRYWEEREQISSFTPPVLYLGGASINEMAKLMSVNAGNMIALQCRRRLQQFIRFRYAKQGEPTPSS